MVIPAQFIDELNQRTDIVELVGEYVKLSKKGNNYWGLCPFHSEKTASFSVTADKQICYCFSCRKGGSAIYFLMEVAGLPFIDAVKELAKRANMEVPEERGNPEGRKRRERLLQLNKEAARFYHNQLMAESGASGREYLFEKRKLSLNTVKKFGLGWAPDGWDNLQKAMLELGYTKGEMLYLGLLVDGKNGRVYDRFRGRVMFPIIDLRGDVIGFGGRVLDDSTPKYLNSSDSEIFNKKRNVFALNLAKKSKIGRIILTEGYMDTIALHQAGFDGAVATLGTAFTVEQVRLITRFTDEVVIAYDSDVAGVSATNRAITNLEETGIKVKVLSMKDAKDPDEFIQRFGAEAFAKIMDVSTNHIEYRIGAIQRKYDLNEGSQRVEFLKEAVVLLASLNSAVEREIYASRCGELAGVSLDAVAQEVKREIGKRIKKDKKTQERKDLTPVAQAQPGDRVLQFANVRKARAEEGVLRLVLLNNVLFKKLEHVNENHFSVPLYGKAFSLLRERWLENLDVTLSGLVQDIKHNEMSHLVGVTQEPQSLENCDKALADYIEIMEVQEEAAQMLDVDPLLAIQKKMLQKKGYGGKES